MTPEKFDEGIKILQVAFRRTYSDDSYKMIWSDFQNLDGEIFISACENLKGEGVKLPFLSELRAAYRTREEHHRRKHELQSLAAPAPVRTLEEKEQTARLLRETTEKLKAKAVLLDAKSKPAEAR